MHIFSKSVKRFVLPALIVAFTQMDVLAQGTDSIAIKEAKNISQLKVSGVVTDAATGKPLTGISISVPGYSASITDDAGAFQVSVPSKNAVLIISGAGFHRKEVDLKGNVKVSIALYEDSYSSIYDIATLPFGAKSRTATTYALTTINTEGAWDKPLETADSYLQGKAAGLDITRRSGTPGIGANMLLRGYSSLYATNQPLIVVDGVLFENSSYGNSLISGFQNNRLGNIDLKDVDNITIIKDGTSTYGTKGANGVILITTARAKDVATRLDFAAYGGVNSKIGTLPVLNSNDYRLYLSDIMRTKPGYLGASFQNEPYMSDVMSKSYFNFHQNTNWQDEIMENGHSQNYYLKVSGGDNIATYSLSMGYLKNNGLTRNTDLTRYQTRFNANLNLSSKLKAQANVAFTRGEQNIANQGLAKDINPLYLSLIKAPFLSPYVMSETNLASPNLSDADLFSVSNPYAAATTVKALDKNYRFVGSIGFNYSLSKPLSLQSVVGLTFDKDRTNTFVPNIGISSVTLNTAEANNRAGATVQRLFSLYTDTWLSYNYKFNGNHLLNTNLGFRFNSSNSESDYGQSYNTASDEFVTLQSGVSTLRSIGGNLGRWNWLNNYLNIDYQAYNKYFVSFNLAADASSRFGKEIKGVPSINGTKIAVLPAIAGAWLISSESFLAENKVIETLKLRASYGLSGNDDLGNYSAKKYYTTQSFLGRQGITRGNIGNQELKWETITKVNIGLDAALFNERINFSFDVFNNKTTNMIIAEPVYSATGFTQMLTNSGAMRASGTELGLQARIINKSKFKWDAGLNITRIKNKVTSVPGMMNTTYSGATTITQVGASPNLFYGYKTNGVYSSDAEAAASGLLNRLSDGSLVPFKGGDIRFVNRVDAIGDTLANGTKFSIINADDKQVIGNPNPDFTGGFDNNFMYKRFTLSTLFTFSAGNDVYNGTRAELESLSGAANQTQAVVNRWQVDGQVTNIPRAVWGDPNENSRFSDRWIENGSYLRLKTLSLSYDVPVKKLFLRSATVYAIANNVLTLTKYLGYDPEFSASSSVFARGVDAFYIPQYKSFQLGVRVGL